MTEPPASSTRSLAKWKLGCILALLLYGALLAYFYAPIAAGADASGYLNNARILSHGRLTLDARTVPEIGSYPWYHFVPLGYWSLEGETNLRPTYPFGVPLQYALAATVAGWYWGPLLVGVGNAVAAVALIYLCARELEISPPIAVACATALALSPIFLACSLQAMSDGPSATWCLAAFYTGLRARRAALWSIACGAASAVAVLVRAPNVLLLPGLAVLLWNWRRLAGAIVGGLPGALALGIAQHTLYGSALRSGYGNFYSTFDLGFIVEGVWHFAKWLGRFSPIVYAPVVLVPWMLRHALRRETFALLAWFGCITIFYAFYPEAKVEAWWGLRFIVPGIPAALLLAGLALESLGRSRPAERRARYDMVAVCVALAITVLPDARWIWKTRILRDKIGQMSYVEATSWAREHLPHDALIASMQISGALYFYTDLPVLRWDQITAADFEKYTATLRRTGRPLYAMLYPWEETEVHTRGTMPGPWEQIAEVHSVRILKFDFGGEKTK